MAKTNLVPLNLNSYVPAPGMEEVRPAGIHDRDSAEPEADRQPGHRHRTARESGSTTTQGMTMPKDRNSAPRGLKRAQEGLAEHLTRRR